MNAYLHFSKGKIHKLQFEESDIIVVVLTNITANGNRGESARNFSVRPTVFIVYGENCYYSARHFVLRNQGEVGETSRLKMQLGGIVVDIRDADFDKTG